MPDAELWQGIADRRVRLRVGLQAIYNWYGRNESLAACALRDGENHALTKEMIKLRIEPHMRAYRGVLGAALSRNQQAMLRMMLSFFTWGTLVREGGLEQGAAVAAAVHAIDGAG